MVVQRPGGDDSGETPADCGRERTGRETVESFGVKARTTVLGIQFTPRGQLRRDCPQGDRVLSKCAVVPVQNFLSASLVSVLRFGKHFRHIRMTSDRMPRQPQRYFKTLAVAFRFCDGSTACPGTRRHCTPAPLWPSAWCGRHGEDNRCVSAVPPNMCGERVLPRNAMTMPSFRGPVCAAQVSDA